jgi:ABC-type lipoprotein export system ATPase subunit
MPEPALHIRNLRKYFRDPEGGRVLVLDVPALDVARGEVLALRGESGSGKTTLLNVIAGILPADEGLVEVAGVPMSGASEPARDALRARHIGYLFQTFNLLAGLTALENVELGMTFRPRGGEPIPQAARKALERVGLSDRLRHRPHQLSVGQQQRVAIARALAGHPTLVVADEPTSNLDRPRAEQCMQILLDFAKDSDAALLVVTHDEWLLEHFERVETLRAVRHEGSEA